MLPKLQIKTSFFVLFAEKVYTVIPSGIGCIRDVVVLEVNWKKIASLNVKHMQISKGI